MTLPPDPSDSGAIADELRRLAAGIGTSILSHLASRDDFGMRTFYGEAFTLALLTRLRALDACVERKLLRAFAAKDRTDSQYHWEFNHYGMLEAGRLQTPLVFKHTPCTNWTLLRAAVQVRSGTDAERGLQVALAKLARMQNNAGLILDDPGVRSFQYHCFSAAMIFETYRATREARLLRAFQRAVAFIRHFILPNGDTLYIGRGQQQSFGYASLAYILSAACTLFEDPTLLDDLLRVTRRIRAHVRADGSLPLVIGGGEEPLPHPDAPHLDPRYPGWYAYNNHFDYLPFSGLFLHKAAELLSEARVTRARPVVQEDYRDRDFLKMVAGGTIAIVARPGGYWTNDLPVPYVYSDGRARTGCYGGEQFGRSIYSVRGIPLPMHGSRSLRWRSLSFFLGRTLVVLSPLGALIRRYEVRERRVDIHSRMLSLLAFRDRYLFPPDGPVVRSPRDLQPAGVEYSASGALLAFEANSVGDVSLEFPACQ
ncbi:MAG TPA: hypothetical protein VG994_09495 [Steroidobacteraceae bacterium]|nr:hypothetical protein [Steroidobacteraceae bacterium]